MRNEKGQYVKGHKPESGFTTGHPSYHTNESRAKLSEIRKEEWKNGERKYHPNSGFQKGNQLAWKGGRYTIWRRKCLLRDNYTCQVCGLYDKEIMQVDHIKPRKKYPELLWEMTNGRAICPNCHERKSIKEKSRYYVEEHS